LVEHLICNQGVAGSNPAAGTITAHLSGRALKNLASEARGILSGFALAAAAVLALTSVNIGIPGQPLLETLRFHICAVFLLLPILMALTGARLRAVLMLALILGSAAEGVWTLTSILNLRNTVIGPFAEPAVSIANFDLTGADPADLVRRLAAEPQDILVTYGTEANSAATIAPAFTSQVGCNGTNTCDLAIFSRLPLVKSEVYTIGPYQKERLLIAELQAGDQILTVIAGHRSKPYFDEQAWSELRLVARRLGITNGPVVVAGGFNAAPWTQDFAAFLTESALTLPPALPSTWPEALGPIGLPIDTFATRGALVTQIDQLPGLPGTDHEGLGAKLSLIIEQD
jgi:endonuclease/exonuclease/phosphatase (EEP) superfamily protein YafD